MALRLEGIWKRFGDVTAVDRVSLRIPDRQFLVLLGPSGCGKSTILRLVAGLEDVTSGEITLDGQASYVRVQADHHRPVG